MEIFPWVEILKTVGPMVAILVFFIWRDWQREVKLNVRIEILEKYQKETLENLVEKSTVALVQCTECFKWVGRVVERFLQFYPNANSGDKPEA